jgi:hypothetical protein
MGWGQEMHEVIAEEYITGSKRTALSRAEGRWSDRLVRVNAVLERDRTRLKVWQCCVGMTAVRTEMKGEKWRRGRQE